MLRYFEDLDDRWIAELVGSTGAVRVHAQRGLTALRETLVERAEEAPSGAGMSGLAGQLTRRLNCAVEVAEPFRRLSIDRGVNRGLIEASGPALAVTAGLATRRPGDK